MLLVNRKTSESVSIVVPYDDVQRLAEQKAGFDVTVKVIKSSGARTRLGFVAPNYVRINRVPNEPASLETPSPLVKNN